MTERPILFSAPMVRALVAGTKTQTRRAVKGVALEWLGGPDSFTPEFVASPENHLCPYGFAGDRLWVREAWGYFDPDGTGQDFDEKNDDGGNGPCKVYAPELMQEGHALRDYWRRRIAYRATWQEPKYGAGPEAPKRWRPSIHMPRWASRITLEVTGVRVERLQDISQADAIAEGIVQLRDTGYGLPDGSFYHAADPCQSYYALFESINGPGSVQANPWLWVVEFRRAAS